MNLKATELSETTSREPHAEHEERITQLAETPNEHESCCTKALRKLRSLLTLSKYGLGIFLILCVTVIWVASSEWIQYIFGDLDFDRPFFLTYFNTTGFSLWNLGFLFVPSWRKIPWDDRDSEQTVFLEDPTFKEVTGEQELDVTAPRGGSGANERKDEATGSRAPTDDARVEEIDLEYHSSGEDEPAPIPEVTREESLALEGEVDVASVSTQVRVRVNRVRPYSLRKIWCCAALFCPFWFLANYLFNVSLSYTSVASNTILSSTSSIWTLLLSYVILKTPVGPLKYVAVALSIGGSALVGFAGNASQSGNSVAGDIIALVSAMFYAIYTTILKWKLPDDDRYPMGVVFGAVGVINLVCFWPGMIILNYVGFEVFAWPTGRQLWPLVLNALIGTNLSDLLWARSVILTSTVVATLGLSLTTPLSMVVDAVIHGYTYTAAYIIGALLVMAGFVVANVEVDFTAIRKKLCL